MLLFGGIFIGTFSIRVYVTLASLLILLFWGRKFSGFGNLPEKRWNNYLTLYVIFIVLMGMSLIINGEFWEYEFIKKVLAYYLVCFVMYYMTSYYITDIKKITTLFRFIGLLVIFNGILTIGQYMNNAIAWGLADIFGDKMALLERVDRAGEDVLSLSIFPGIFGGPVANGYYSSVLFPLVLSLTRIEKNRLWRFLSWIATAVAVITIYLSQQRTGFVLMILAFSIFYYSSLKRKPFILLFSLLFIVCLTVNVNWSSLDVGRLNSQDSTGREELYAYAGQFIRENWLFGGPIKYSSVTSSSAHNILLDSIIFAGIFGAIALLILYFKTLKESLRKLVYSLKFNNPLVCGVTVSLISAMLNGLTHNMSYLTGEVTIFMLLSLMVSSENFNVGPNDEDTVFLS